MSTPSVSGRPAPPRARRHVMSTGTALLLIALGAILRFAFATTSIHGLNVHVVGVILILIGVTGLVRVRWHLVPSGGLKRRYPQKIAVGSPSISRRRSSTCADGASRS